MRRNFQTLSSSVTAKENGETRVCSTGNVECGSTQALVGSSDKDIKDC